MASSKPTMSRPPRLRTPRKECVACNKPATPFCLENHITLEYTSYANRKNVPTLSIPEEVDNPRPTPQSSNAQPRKKLKSHNSTPVSEPSCSRNLRQSTCPPLGVSPFPPNQAPRLPTPPPWHSSDSRSSLGLPARPRFSHSSSGRTSPFLRKLWRIGVGSSHLPAATAHAPLPPDRYHPCPYRSQRMSSVTKRTVSNDSSRIHKAYDDKCNELTVVAGQLQVYKGVNELLTRQLEDLLQRQAALWKYLGEREEEITYLKNINSRQPEAPIPEDRKDQRIAELSRELKNLKAQVEAGHRRGNYSLGKRRFVDYEE